MSHCIHAQDTLSFNMNQHKPLFSKLVEFKHFYPTMELVDSVQMNLEIEHIKRKYAVKADVLQEIYHELHILPICHKMLTNIDGNTWNEEKRFNLEEYKYTDMTSFSGRLFVHEGNLDLRNLILTDKHYDIDTAIILRDVETGIYHFYLAKCSDTVLPFRYID